VGEVQRRRAEWPARNLGKRYASGDCSAAHAPTPLRKTALTRKREPATRAPLDAPLLDSRSATVLCCSRS